MQTIKKLKIPRRAKNRFSKFFGYIAARGGQMGAAGIAAGAAALSANRASDQLKKAYGCQREAQREQEQESSERIGDNGFPGSRDSDAYDNCR